MRNKWIALSIAVLSVSFSYGQELNSGNNKKRTQVEVQETKERKSFATQLTSLNEKTVLGDKYQFDLEGYEYLLVVNTASQCGLVDQLADMQEIHEKLEGRVKVIGVPTGDFKEQEFATGAEIAEFCQSKYGVSFDMLEKNSTNSPSKSSLFEVLFNKMKLEKPSWNYQKYLIHLPTAKVQMFSPKDRLNSETITKYITKG